MIRTGVIDFGTATRRGILWACIWMFFSLFLHADTYSDAMRLKQKAEEEQSHGRLEEALRMFITAEEMFSKCHGAETEQSLCLYYTCISYFNQRDLPFMHKPMRRLQQLARRYPENIFIQYDYLSVLAAYESAVYEEKPSDKLRDQFMVHFKQAVYWQSKMTAAEWKKRQINPMFNLMNIAVLYDLSYNPPLIDSMQVYIDRALAVNHLPWGDKWDHVEGLISAYDLQAWILLYKQRYKEAEAKEQEVLAMIKSLEADRSNNVLTEKGEAYEFFVELYKAMGQPKKAMEYLELRNDCNRKRFDIEKNNAIRDIEARYEAKKKDEQIAELHRRNLALTVGIVLLLLFVTVSIAMVIYRRKLREQRLYDEALAAELENSNRHSSLRLLADQLGISDVDVDEAHSFMEQAQKPLTVVDQKYILCFLNGEDVKAISRRFHVEPASVYTVRYRIKKKFPEKAKLPF